MNRRLDEVPAVAAMGRILQAVQPDIIGMSEVEDFSANHVRDLLDAWLPLESGSWHVANAPTHRCVVLRQRMHRDPRQPTRDNAGGV